MDQSTQPEIDKNQYEEIQAILQQNPTITGFDLYYLGFISFYASEVSLESSFHNIRNIINLHAEGLLTREEKIQFLIKTISKKVDPNLIKSLLDNSEDIKTETERIWGDYLNQILKLIPKYENISRLDLFYLGRFHAICPHYKITELFHHINNINILISEDHIDDEVQVDFLIKTLNKKIKAHQDKEYSLNIPKDQETNEKEGQILNNDMMIEKEDVDSKED